MLVPPVVIDEAEGAAWLVSDDVLFCANSLPVKSSAKKRKLMAAKARVPIGASQALARLLGTSECLPEDIFEGTKALFDRNRSGVVG